MRISRLRLLGFKSFVDPTELVIEPGLTGVVGPNGCGKSNLLEALRWVMGETSHKSMRAAAMDDVIFAGTASRPQREMAEVAMVLDNAERRAPAEFNDSDLLEITRRIEREAGSNYRINGREVRARDIKLLFEDAATGARSPSLVRQGQIGDIVNAKPEARRRILEDAAGTAGLYTRRHEAELRLAAAEANLARLDDVVGGLESQVETLKRQARQARRYKDLSADIRKAEALYHFVCWSEAAHEVEATRAALTEVMVRHGEAVRAESEMLKAEAAAEEALVPLRENEATRAAILARKRIEAEHFEREAAAALARADELRARCEDVGRDLGREENFAREAGEIISRLEAEMKTLEVDASKDAGALAEREAALAARDAETAACEETLSAATVDAATRRARKSELSAAHNRQRARREELERRLAGLDEEIARAAAAAAAETSPATGEQLEAAVAETVRAIDDGEAGLAALDAEIANAGETAAANRATALEARTRLAEIETEARTLRTVLGPAGRPGEAAAAIADALEVETGYETALGAALGDDLDVPADDRAPVRWSLLPQPTTPDPALPADLEPLAAKVSGAPALQRRLAQIGLVATKADGDRLQATLAPGQRLVTKNGDLWRWDGFVAASDGATAAARRLAQKNRLAALAGEEAAARQRAEHAAAAEQEAAGALSGLEARRTAARDDLRRLRAALAEDTRRLEQVRERRRKADAEAARRTGDRDRLFEDLETARTAETDLASDLSTLDEAALAAAERAQADAQTKARAARDAQSEARAALTALKREADARARRIATLRGEIADWRERRKAAAAHIAELTRRRDDLDRERETVAALPEDIAARRSEHDAAVAAAEAEHRAAGDALATAQTEHRAAQAALREAQAAHAEAREARARAEARNEAAAQALESETQRIRETLSVTPEACLAIAEREEADDTPLPRRADIERHLSRLKADRDRLGGVNLQADDDLEKIGGEIARIVAERDDVLEGVAKLRGAIGQLNREGRKRLADAFKSVDEHFQRLFAILFGGGEARLQLIENADDPLQGGLEIIARPPGKKPATLSLLSGGEQTLTALSLIFAVFLTNPSPICVLDEVDAPLDDANVDRFCTMMEQMAAETETRFLVITHHPMTMTRMNRLFGVTMAEKGVSQLVSVDLETAQGFREAS